MTPLRYIVIAFGALTIAGFFISQIKDLENIRRGGKTVLLDLRPADPRALMMGGFYDAGICRRKLRNLAEGLGALWSNNSNVR